MPGDRNGTFWLYDRKCPECGKIFCMPYKDLWAYKDGDRILCSWHCLRAREKRREEKVAKIDSMAGSIRLSEEQVERIQALIRQGRSVREISVLFGVSREVIRYHKRKMRKKT